MITIHGYVIMTKGHHHCPLFGQPLEGDEMPFSNIELNGLMPFATIDEAITATRGFDMGTLRTAGIGKLLIEVADSEKEARNLLGRSDLIIVMCQNKAFLPQVWLFGHPVEGPSRSGTFFASSLFGNGLQCFDPDDDVADVVFNAGRQGDGATYLATFSLNFIVM